MPKKPGVVAMLENDLTIVGSNWLFGMWSSRTSVGAVSVARFRSEEGPAEVGAPLSPERLALSKTRFKNQLTSTVAKILGMSFPCEEQQKCVLRFPRTLKEFDAKGGDFCPKHQQEIARILQR